MRASATVSKVFMWIFMVFYLAIQALTVFGLSSNNAAAIEAGKTESVFSIVPLVTATLLMLAAVIVFSILHRFRYIPVIVGFVAAAVMLMVALELGRMFPSSIGTGDTDVGLTTWKLVWRHIGIAIVPVCMLAAWLFGRSADKAEQARESARTHFDLSGGAIFTDHERDGEEILPPRKLKRSLRKKLEKMQQETDGTAE